MTPAMSFGIRDVETDDDLAGLTIAGTGDVFAPGGAAVVFAVGTVGS